MGTKLDVAFKFGAGRYIQEPERRQTIMPHIVKKTALM